MPSSSPKAPWWLHSYTVIGLGVLCVTGAEIALKLGASATANNSSPLAGSGVLALASGWTWLAIMFFIGSFLTWIYVLRTMPLHIAFNLSSIEYVLVPMAAWCFLGETINLHRWCGILLVVVGVVIIATPATKAEERL